MAANGEFGDELEEFVAELVASGRYQSKREVLLEGIRLVQEREARLRTSTPPSRAGLQMRTLDGSGLQQRCLIG